MQYQDPNYSGASIGEYQYYNWNYKSWDASTCQTDRCAKMDCHDDDTETWQLVGVYKASVEFDNDTWFEQLFKHEGYCLWDGDKQSSYSTNGDYSFMQTLREQWPDECTELSDIQNYNGQSYYLGTKPLAGGRYSPIYIPVPVQVSALNTRLPLSFCNRRHDNGHLYGFKLSIREQSLVLRLPKKSRESEHGQELGKEFGTLEFLNDRVQGVPTLSRLQQGGHLRRPSSLFGRV